MKIRLLVVLVIVIVGIQFVPVDRGGPPPERPLQAPPDVAAVLRASCYDCHSAETAWPWYSRIAPASWLVTHDVAEGREHLDFSRWGLLTTGQRAEAYEEIVEAVAAGEMPLPIYTVMHRDAKVTAEELLTLRRWAEAGGHGGND